MPGRATLTRRGWRWRGPHAPLLAWVGLRLSAHVAEFPPVTVALPWRIPGADPVTARLLFTMTRGVAISSRVFDSAQWHPALRTAGIAAQARPGRRLSER
jgi:hypothetical protein